MDEYDWSEASALWQIEKGDPGTDRTDSAFDYLLTLGDKKRDRQMVGQLLAIIERLRPLQ